MKRLYRSSKDKKLDGVCAGIAEYFALDPTLVRVAFVTLVVLTGVVPGIALYVLLAIIMPRDDR